MAAKKKKKPKAAVERPKIHEATLASGSSGAVLKAPEIDVPTAVARRRAGLDVVVCGDGLMANQRLARQNEAAVGPYDQQAPPYRAGPHALPHLQPRERPPEGHPFYESDNPNRKARKTS